MIGFNPDNVKLAPVFRKLLICAARSGSSEFKLQFVRCSGKLKLEVWTTAHERIRPQTNSLRYKDLAKNKFV